MAECCLYDVRPKPDHDLSDSDTEREIERKGILVCGYILEFGRRTRRPDPNSFGQRLLIYLAENNQKKIIKRK